MTNSTSSLPGWAGSTYDWFTSVSNCIADPEKCGEDYIHEKMFGAAKYILYEGPKAAAGFAYWGTKTCFNVASYCLKKNHIKLPDAASETFRNAVHQIKELSHIPTSWITGKTIEQLKEIYAAEIPLVKAGKAPAFRAGHLILPLALHIFLQQQAWKNLNNAFKHGKSLLLGRRTEVNAYEANAEPVPGPTMKKGNSITHTELETSTTFGLLKDVLVESALTAIWGLGAYISAHAIYEKVREACNSDERASLVIKSLMIGCAVTPWLISWVDEAIRPPPSTDTYGTSKAAPHLLYTDPPFVVKKEVEVYPDTSTLDHLNKPPKNIKEAAFNRALEQIEQRNARERAGLSTSLDDTDE